MRHRNARAMVVALGLVIGVVALFFTRSDAKVVETIRTEGILVEERSIGTTPILVIELEDGRHARVTPAAGVRPKRIGTKVPLIITRTDDGREQARFDQDTWLSR